MKIIIKSYSKVKERIYELYEKPCINIAGFSFFGFDELFLNQIDSLPAISDETLLACALDNRMIVDVPFYYDDEIVYADHETIIKLEIELPSYKTLLKADYELLGSLGQKISLERNAEKLNILIRESFPSNLNEAAVSFSGGVDCTLIAANLLKFGVKKLNLVTVCVGSDSFDEIMAKEAAQTLQDNFKDAIILHEICKIDKLTAEEVRKTLKELKYVKQDIMNLNIATCHYFAAKNFSQNVIYTGTGADELFGGYHRLKTKMAAGGFSSVKEDMMEAIQNLPMNNLYRDFEVYYRFNKKLIHPFLNNEVIKLASVALYHNQCPLFADYNDIPGDKIIVRLALAKIIDIKSIHTPKKAIQFSTKIASLDKRAKGTDKI